jgi:hypothetical protein
VSGPGDLSELLRGPVANEVLNAIVRDQTVRRTNGRAPQSWVLPLLELLAEAADVPVPQRFADIGGRFGIVRSAEAIAMVSTREAADLAGCSERTAREHAAAGRVRCQRVGRRSWLVDAESLQRVIGRNRDGRTGSR